MRKEDEERGRKTHLTIEDCLFTFTQDGVSRRTRRATHDAQVGRQNVTADKQRKMKRGRVERIGGGSGVGGGGCGGRRG